ncbi:MAG: histidine--tRNA ligase, partial [Nitrospinota bacterium]
SYIEHSMHHPSGTVTKLYYFGPMFRRERPQAGRFRQFFQIGAELFGTISPDADADVIQLLHLFVQAANVKGPELLLNSLGCSNQDCRPAYKKALVDFLTSRKAELCDLCGERYERNPLRVLDCKTEKCRVIAENAPMIDAHRCGGCDDHFGKVQKLLKELNIPFTLNPRMVRGLDYYTRTVFEVTAEGLGAKDSIAGGGRYDDLVKNSGGPDIPAIGFAVGMERLMESVAGGKADDSHKPDVYMVSMGEAAARAAFVIAGKLRGKGIKVERSYNQLGMKNQMGKAGKSGARLAVIIGEDELAKNAAVIKDLSTGDQKEYPMDGIESAISDILA